MPRTPPANRPRATTTAAARPPRGTAAPRPAIAAPELATRANIAAGNPPVAASLPPRLSLFAIAAPGLESIVLRELQALARQHDIGGIVAEAGGIAFEGSLAALYACNLWLRTASRVVVRVASFRATAFFALEKQARKIPWSAFVAPGAPVRFRVTCRKSKLYHSDAVAERFAAAVARSVGGGTGIVSIESGDELADVDAATADADDASPTLPDVERAGQLFIVRLVRDQCTVSADSSGALLHMRGYRQSVAKAPLRETLGAAVLLGAGWDGTTPLADPMCGSGTLAIEGALIARRMPPGGGGRPFAFMRWPGWQPAVWKRLTSAASAGALARSPVPILAFDRDAGAVAATLANAARAGVAGDITVVAQALSHFTPPPGGAPGLVAVNPPYGVRLGNPAPLRDLYATLGRVMRERAPGWSLAVLTAERALAAQVGLELDERLRTTNGGIEVRLGVAAGTVGEREDR